MDSDSILNMRWHFKKVLKFYFTIKWRSPVLWLYHEFLAVRDQSFLDSCFFFCYRKSLWVAILFLLTTLGGTFRNKISLRLSKARLPNLASQPLWLKTLKWPEVVRLLSETSYCCSIKPSAQNPMLFWIVDSPVTACWLHLFLLISMVLRMVLLTSRLE